MLEMKNVSYSYHVKKRGIVPVLIDQSLSFEAGKMYALFGPSGAGKTTCLALLGGLEIPQTGEILLDGKSIAQIGYRRLRQQFVSYIFQDYQLFPYMTALENVMVAARISKKEDKTVLQERCDSMLKTLGLGQGERTRKVTELSGGQQQRVAIARALITDADYILADEPTGNLDKANTKNIVALMKDIAHERNKCVIIVTHSEYVKKQCDIFYPIGGYEDEDE